MSSTTQTRSLSFASTQPVHWLISRSRLRAGGVPTAADLEAVLSRVFQGVCVQAILASQCSLALRCAHPQIENNQDTIQQVLSFQESRVSGYAPVRRKLAEIA